MRQGNDDPQVAASLPHRCVCRVATDRRPGAAQSLEELVFAGGADGAGDAGAESPLDAGAVFVSVAGFFSAGVASAEELLLFEE